MTSTPTPTSFIERVTKNLHWAERAFLIALAIGTILVFSKINSSVLNVSLIGLAITFFLYAYKPLNIVREENELLGFSDLLAVGILPRVMWISSAISTLGLLFYLMDNAGHKNMLMIGGLTIGISVVLLTIFLVSGVKNIKIVTPILFRAIPLLTIDIYILFK
jgi:hypothetical protein